MWMTKKQVKQAIKAAQAVHAWCNLVDHDGVHIPISKRDAIAAIEYSSKMENVTQFRAMKHEDGTVTLG